MRMPGIGMVQIDGTMQECFWGSYTKAKWSLLSHMDSYSRANVLI